MSLREVTIPIRFRGGVDSGTDPLLVTLDHLLAAENAVLDTWGVLAKRNGHTNLGRSVMGSVSELMNTRKLGRRNDELLLMTDDKVYSYIDATSEWAERGDFQSCKLTNRVVAGTVGDQTLADCATNDGVTAYAWEDSQGGVYYSVVDATTGAVITRPTQLDVLATKPRVHAVGNKLHVYYALAASNAIWVRVISPDNPKAAETEASVILLDNLDSTLPYYDIDSTPGTKAVIAWAGKPASPTSNITAWLGYITADAVLGSPMNGEPAAIDTTRVVASALGVCIDPITDEGEETPICVMHGQTNQATCEYYDATNFTANNFTVLNTGITVDNITGAWENADSGEQRQLYIFWEVNNATDQYRYVEWQLRFDDGSLVGSTFTQKGVGLAAKAFRDKQTGEAPDVYVGLVHDTTLFATYFVMRDDQLIVARILPGTAAGVTPSAHLPTVTNTSRTATWAATFNRALESEDRDVFTEKGIQSVKLEFAATDAYQSAQLGATTYIAGGGMIQAFAGDGIFEAGFHVGHDGGLGFVDAAGAIPDGTYVYRVAPEYVLPNGEIVQGPVSAGTSVTLSGGPKKVTLTINQLRVTAMRAPFGECRWGIYRTESGGANLYRVSSLDPTESGDNGYLANDPTKDTLTFVDNMTDATLLKQEPIYTQGGILSNDPPPCGNIIAAGKDRLFWNDPEDPDVVRYSQTIRAGYAAELSSQSIIRIPPEGGAITAIAVADDVTYVFRETAMYAFSGPGPLANPDAGGGFSPVQQVPSDVGCTNQASLTVFPGGVAFKSEKGIYLIDRGRQVHYIGRKVEKYNGQDVVSADLIEDRTQIRFLTSSGVTLFWDYSIDQWTEALNHEGDDAVVVGSAYHYLRANGDTWKEDSSYQDGTQHIPMAAETPEIHFSQSLQGFQMIWHLYVRGNYKSDHTINVRAAVDGEPDFSIHVEDIEPDDYYDPANYGEGNYGDGNYGGDNVQRHQFSVHIGAKCSSIRFRIEVNEDSADYGAGMEILELLVTGGVIGPSYQDGDSRSN